MSTGHATWRRAVLPVGVFIGVAALHFVWLAIFPERDPAQARWAAVVAANGSALLRYIETQSYWLGLSYALALAFTATAFRRYREEAFCSARTLAIGSMTFSGFFAIAGCYLIGCCGSPMLAVYVSLFGAHFLPLTKPIVAAFTTLSVVVAWWWMKMKRAKRSDTALASGAVDCGCDEELRAVPRGLARGPRSARDRLSGYPGVR